MTFRERFDAKWEAVTETGCWLWTACTDSKGYGLFRVPNKRSPLGAHRISWELANGPIPDGLCACHTCDTPACVNPQHLFLGSRKDNSVDRDKKGRNVAHKGEKHWAARITSAQVLEIRKDPRLGPRVKQAMREEDRKGALRKRVADAEAREMQTLDAWKKWKWNNFWVFFGVNMAFFLAGFVLGYRLS